MQHDHGPGNGGERVDMAWAAKWRSQCLLDGKTEYLIGAGLTPPLLFKTRADCRAYIRIKYSYLATRPDLRREPHGWKMPVPVKVIVRIREVA